MAEVSSVATTPIAPAQVSAPAAEVAKVETAPAPTAPAETAGVGAGPSSGTPTDSQGKKLYLMA